MRLFRRRLRQKLFFVHIMKTGGTSLRKMLTQATARRKDVYPNNDDLKKMPNHWYPPVKRVVQDMHDRALRDFDILCGHYPLILGEHLFDRPFWTAAILRDPVERTLSMLAHKKSNWPEYADTDPRAMLDDEQLVANQIQDYQTKVFAFDHPDECSESVNCPLDISTDRFERACQRLRDLDIIGLTERFEESVARVQRLTGLKFPALKRKNVTGSQWRIGADDQKLEQRIIELVPRDIKFYALAQKLFDEQT